MNARRQAQLLAEELRRRHVPVELDPYSTSDLGFVYHPRVDGPVAFMHRLNDDNSGGWGVVRHTPTGSDPHQYTGTPSALDTLPVDAPISDVADAVQYYLENQLPPGRDATDAINEHRANYGTQPLLIVLRGQSDATDTVAAQWTEIVRDQFDAVFCINADDHRTEWAHQPAGYVGIVKCREIVQHLLTALGVPIPVRKPDGSLWDADADPDYGAHLRRLYLDATARMSVLVHLHNSDEPAQARWVLPSARNSVAIITTRQQLSSLYLDDAFFLDV